MWDAFSECFFFDDNISRVKAQVSYPFFGCYGCSGMVYGVSSWLSFGFGPTFYRLQLAPFEVEIVYYLLWMGISERISYLEVSEFSEELRRIVCLDCSFINKCYHLIKSPVAIVVMLLYLVAILVLLDVVKTLLGICKYPLPILIFVRVS